MLGEANDSLTSKSPELAAAEFAVCRRAGFHKLPLAIVAFDLSKIG